MMASEALQSLISLKVMVEKEKNQVVFAESNSDFVDVLFSFMTMTTGNIIRLVREHSLEVDFGCLNNLYQSVENLDKEHLQSVKCKDLLLCPRSAAEIYCRNLKLNFVNSDTNEYYCCSNHHHFGPYYYALCNCGRAMCITCHLNHRVSVHQDEGVFVKPTTRFIITDDFHVEPVSTMTVLTVLSKFGATYRSIREERTISIGRDKVLKLIMCSLTSRAPFSETILESAIDKNSSDICHKKYGPRNTVQCQRTINATKKETKISLKLIINKSNNRVLYVEAKEDFVDLIVGFLTFPLGFVFEKFTSLSLRGCLGNLYKSIQDFDAEFLSEEMKSIFVNPKLAPGLAIDKQLIPIGDASYPSYSTVSSLFNVSNKGYIGGEKIIGKGFIRGSSMFMVTDDFTITPLSSFSIISFIDRLSIPLSDILEQKLIMGEEEALCLLEAAFMSKTALTDVFILEKLTRKLDEESDN